MDEQANILRNRIPLGALSAYALIVVACLARLALVPAAPKADVASVPFRVGPAIPSTLDVHTMSRGSLAHDGVDHLSTLVPPMQLAWLKPVNVGVIGGGMAEPTVDASGVYVGTDSGWLHALTHEGETRWTYFDANAAGGVTGAPATDAKVVYFGTSAGNLVAIEKTTGRVAWIHRFEGSIAAAPVIFEDSVLATVSSGRGSSFVTRIKRSDGATEWQSDVIEANSSSGPALDRVTQMLFVGAGDRRVHAFSIKSGRRVWDRELDADVDATPALVGGQLYVASNGEFVYSLKALNGEVVWKSLVTGGSRATVTWEPASNILVVGTNRGMLYAFDRHGGKARWIDKTGTIFSGMAGALSVSRTKKDQSSRLVWTTCADTVVCALDPRSGNIVEKIPTLGPVASSPVVYNDTLYLLESTGSLRKYVSKH